MGAVKIPEPQSSMILAMEDQMLHEVVGATGESFNRDLCDHEQAGKQAARKQ